MRADLVALGANAIFNPWLLLRSGLDHGGAGRGLTEQRSRSVRLRLADLDGGGGGTSITGLGYPFADGPFRRERAAAVVETHNKIEIFAEPGQWRRRWALRFVFEDLPNPDNRVILDPDDDDRPAVRYGGPSEYLLRSADAVEGWAAEFAAPIAREPPEPRPTLNATESHILCTHRMGRRSGRQRRRRRSAPPQGAQPPRARLRRVRHLPAGQPDAHDLGPVAARGCADRRMKRRAVLAGGAVLAAAGAVGWGLSPSTPSPPRRPRRSAARVLNTELPDAKRWSAFRHATRRRLAPIQLEEALFDAFVAAHRAAGRALPETFGDLQDLQDTLLLSTDFFHEGADLARPPRFVAYFDPYISPCWSPFPPA